jgi:hypothetical protein
MAYVIDDDSFLRICGFTRGDADSLQGEFQSIENALGIGGATYDVRLNGMTLNDGTKGTVNRLAFQALLDLIKALHGDKGATIFLPDGDLYIDTNPGVGDTHLASMRFQGHNNIAIRGNGPSSRLIWQGDLGGGAKHLFWLSGGYVGSVQAGITVLPTFGATFADFAVMAGDLTNRDVVSEQNHLFNVVPDQRGPVQDVTFRNMLIGHSGGGDGIAQVGDLGPITGQASYVERLKVINCRIDARVHAMSTPPVIGFRSPILFQRAIRGGLVAHTYITGSDDQLIDFEPTGNGGIEDVQIVNNRLEVYSISGAAQGNPARGVLAVTLSGNGTGTESNHRMIFAGNHLIGGRIQAVRIENAIIADNVIVTDGSTDNSPALEMTTHVTGCQVTGNKFLCDPAAAMTTAISVTNNALAVGERPTLRFDGNQVLGSLTTVKLVSVDSVSELFVQNNRLEHVGVSANTGIAVAIRGSNAPIGGIITDNLINGSLGGGTLQYGVSVFCDDNVADRVAVRGNQGKGIATAGVRIEPLTAGGSYVAWPVCTGNDMPGGLSLGSGTYAVIAGNNGDVTTTTGGNTSPEGVITAPQGSRHIRKNGDSTSEYFKATGTGSTGWVQVTVP